MDPTLTPELNAFRQAVRRFALERLRPNYLRWQTEPLPREEVQALGEMGLLGLRAPERLGGQGGSFLALGIAAEEVGRGDLNMTYFLQLHNILCEALVGAGSPLAETWVPRLARGEVVGAFALTEPEAGSDAQRVRTRAWREGDFWVLEGEKASISFAGLADVGLVMARTGGEGARGISALWVDLHQPGVRRIVYNSPGGKLTRRGSLVFQRATTPLDHLLGPEGTGFYTAMRAFDFNRPVIGLALVGTALQSVEETIEYVKTRHAFGRPLARFEGVSFQIAEHLTTLHASRLLCYDALRAWDAGRPSPRLSAMAKWFAQQSAERAVHACLLLHGHLGYSTDLPFDQRLRDIIGLEIGDGTAEVMKLIIVRETLGRDFLPYP